MKATKTGLFAGLLIVALVGGVTVAVEPDAAQPVASTPKPSAGHLQAPARPNPQAVFDRLVSELGMTDEQQSQVKQLWQTHQQAVENWARQHRDELADLANKAKAAADKPDELRTILEQRRKIMAGRNELMEQFVKQLGDVLSPDQLQKAKAILVPVQAPKFRPLAVVMQLDLSQTQKAQVEQIRNKALEQAQQAQTLQEKEDILKAALEKIKSEVLNDTQRAKLAELMQPQPKAGPGGFGLIDKLDLSADQQSQIDVIRKQAAEKMAAADTPDAKRAAFHEAMKQIEQVLTPEQLAKLAELRQAARPKPADAPVRHKARQQTPQGSGGE